MRNASLFLVLAACTDTNDSLIEGTQSLRVELVSPASPGSIDTPLGDGDRTVVLNLTALDAQGELDTSFSKQVQVYAQFLGTLTPTFGSIPLASFEVTNGEASNQSVTLPNAFGPTVIWIDDGEGVGPEYIHGQVTGTSPILFYRAPLIADLQTPRDAGAGDPPSATPPPPCRCPLPAASWPSTAWASPTSRARPSSRT